MVTVIPNRLYWLSDKSPPEGIRNAFYFCTDKDLKYYPFFSDFGPLNIAQVVRFAAELEKLLKLENLLEKAIYHYTSEKSTERLNSAFIMGTFMVSSPGPQAADARRQGGRHVLVPRPAPHRLPRRLLRRLQLQVHAPELSARHRDGGAGAAVRPAALRPAGLRVLREGAERGHELDHPQQNPRLFDAQPEQEAAGRRELTSSRPSTRRTTSRSSSSSR